MIEALKSRARVLHRRATDKDPEALGRLRAVAELKALDDAALAAAVRRRHALAVVARELGFRGWPHLISVVQDGATDDFGTLLVPETGGAYWNIWSARYEEARSIREAHGGYLLAYRHQFLIVDADYVTMLGLDPEDPDWDRMGRDWVRPRDPSARARLYEKLVLARG